MGPPPLSLVQSIVGRGGLSDSTDVGNRVGSGGLGLSVVRPHDFSGGTGQIRNGDSRECGSEGAARGGKPQSDAAFRSGEKQVCFAPVSRRL